MYQEILFCIFTVHKQTDFAATVASNGGNALAMETDSSEVQSESFGNSEQNDGPEYELANSYGKFQ